MKTYDRGLFILLIFQVFISCSKESFELEQASKEKLLETNTEIADLMLRVSMNDGSNDNIIDMANCFNIQLPVNVEANGQELTIESEDDYNRIEVIFDASRTDEDLLNIQFPITIIETDYSEVQISNIDELRDLANECTGENIDDEDIECIDFIYPITAATFNTNTELTNRITLTNDKQLYELIHSLNESLVINIDFPITIRLFDGTELAINDLFELENRISEAKDICDEDDDFDYNDDDEEEEEGDHTNVTESEFTNLLTSCNWAVEEVHVGGTDATSTYGSYAFTFNTNGTVIADNTDTNVSGTWSITTKNNDNLYIVINMDAPLTDFNNEWILVEINGEDDGTRMEIEIGEDELKLKQECN